jgi:hypothetical protein
MSRYEYMLVVQIKLGYVMFGLSKKDVDHNLTMGLIRIKQINKK